MANWTIKALKEYFEELRRADQTAVQAALQAAKEAVIKAETAADKRFESVNEFRKALSDQAQNQVTRIEWDASQASTIEKIQRLENWQAGQTGVNKTKDTDTRTTLIIIGIAVSGFFSFMALTLGTVTLVVHLTGH